MTVAAARGHAQEACKTEQLKDSKLALADMFVRADARAKAWKSDAVVARLGNTSLGPLDEQGRSEAWAFTFLAVGQRERLDQHFPRLVHVLRLIRGSGPPARSETRLRRRRDKAVQPGETARRLVARTGRHGLVQTAAAPSTRHATWYITFDKDNKSGGLTVIVDANTGALEKVLK